MANLDRYIELMQFELANRSFCVDVDQVVGVITLPPHMKEIPETVPFQSGAVRVHPLEEMLELEARVARCPHEIIILRDSGEHFGICVDWIGEIHKVPLHRAVFRFPNSTRTRIRMFGVWGMAVLGEDLALILEPRTLMEESLQQRLTPEMLAQPLSRTEERRSSHYY